MEENCKCEHKHSKKMADIKINEDEIIKLEKFYCAFSTASRLKIIYALDNCSMCVCEIAHLLNMSKSAVSHQLGFLKKLDLVKGIKLGKEVMYSLSDDHVRKLFEISVEHIREKKS